MASKLQKHEEHILEMLTRGDSYACIANALKNIGCKTSIQNLFMWVRRRPAKLRARQALVNAWLLQPRPETASTSSAMNAPRFLTAEFAIKTPRIGSESATHTESRSAENDIYEALRNVCSEPLLPVVFSDRKFRHKKVSV